MHSSLPEKSEASRFVLHSWVDYLVLWFIICFKWLISAWGWFPMLFSVFLFCFKFWSNLGPLTHCNNTSNKNKKIPNHLNTLLWGILKSQILNIWEHVCTNILEVLEFSNFGIMDLLIPQTCFGTLFFDISKFEGSQVLKL